MELTLTDKEMRELLVSVFANGALSVLADSSVDINVTNEQYMKVKESYKKNNPLEPAVYQEDVFAEILMRGEPLPFYDCDSDEEICFNLDQFKKNCLTKADCIEDVLLVINGNDDAFIGNNILQYALYGEVIYG